ncbi:hypothetical protein AZA_46411 [Nitrospirillum viridazoti Y2]|nr:hypothetical protein AZA_46411 [Nitrospirillum amazonense Y2]
MMPRARRRAKPMASANKATAPASANNRPRQASRPNSSRGAAIATTRSWLGVRRKETMVGMPSSDTPGMRPELCLAYASANSGRAFCPT